MKPDDWFGRWDIWRFWRRHWLREVQLWWLEKWQRANRGYADSDIWSLDAHLCRVLIPALAQVKDHNGYPGNLTHEEWQAKLDTMIAGFEAARDIIELNLPDGADFEVWRAEREAARRAGFAEFTEWFTALWT